MNLDVDFLLRIARSPIRNYVVPGLTSWLIGDRSELGGCARLFVCEREQLEHVTPHSHRFDFHAVVLRGHVTNSIWRPARPLSERGDLYACSELGYGGKPGDYTLEDGDFAQWVHAETTYGPGQTYAMESHEVHSIIFSSGAVVLVFEGPRCVSKSQILQPVVDGNVVPTFKVEPWMFHRETPAEVIAHAS